MTKDHQSTTKADCTHCKHYYITWEAEHPHGCRHFNFKSPYLPSLAVVESSHNQCLAFSAKPIHQTSTHRSKNQTEGNSWIV